MNDRKFEEQLQAMLQRNTTRLPKQEPVDAQIVETIPQESAPTEKEVILYQADDGNINVSVYYYEETFWLNVKAMSELFDCSTNNILVHLKNIFNEKELDEISTSKFFEIVQIIAIQYLHFMHILIHVFA